MTGGRSTVPDTFLPGPYRRKSLDVESQNHHYPVGNLYTTFVAGRGGILSEYVHVCFKDILKSPGNKVNLWVLEVQPGEQEESPRFCENVSGPVF